MLARGSLGARRLVPPAAPTVPARTVHAAHAHTRARTPARACTRVDYERHRPEQAVLYQIVERHWPALRERAEQAGGLPRFVLREMEEYFRCGVLAAHASLRSQVIPPPPPSDDDPATRIGAQLELFPAATCAGNADARALLTACHVCGGDPDPRLRW